MVCVDFKNIYMYTNMMYVVDKSKYRYYMYIYMWQYTISPHQLPKNEFMVTHFVMEKIPGNHLANRN